MAPADVLAFEARWRTRAAIGSAAGAVLVLAGGIALVATLSDSKTNELTSQLLFYDQHSSSLLLATIVARDANPASFVRLRFDCNMEDGGAEIRSQSVWMDSASTT